jgi:hypothetical protein
VGVVGGGRWGGVGVVGWWIGRWIGRLSVCFYIVVDSYCAL